MSIYIYIHIYTDMCIVYVQFYICGFMYNFVGRGLPFYRWGS
jgi:hypothetical protein